MSGLSSDDHEALDNAVCPDCQHGVVWHIGECDFSWTDGCECRTDFSAAIASAVEAIVARHVTEALTAAAERVKRAGHGDEPLNDEARAVYGTHFYNDAARIVRSHITDPRERP